jgi:hypothetical protein
MGTPNPARSLRSVLKPSPDMEAELAWRDYQRAAVRARYKNFPSLQMIHAPYCNCWASWTDCTMDPACEYVGPAAASLPTTEPKETP